MALSTCIRLLSSSVQVQVSEYLLRLSLSLSLTFFARRFLGSVLAAAAARGCGGRRGEPPAHPAPHRGTAEAAPERRGGGGWLGRRRVRVWCEGHGGDCIEALNEGSHLYRVGLHKRH